MFLKNIILGSGDCNDRSKKLIPASGTDEIILIHRVIIIFSTMVMAILLQGIAYSAQDDDEAGSAIKEKIIQELGNQIEYFKATAYPEMNIEKVGKNKSELLACTSFLKNSLIKKYFPKPKIIAINQHEKKKLFSILKSMAEANNQKFISHNSNNSYMENYKYLWKERDVLPSEGFNEAQLLYEIPESVGGFKRALVAIIILDDEGNGYTRDRGLSIGLSSLSNDGTLVSVGSAYSLQHALNMEEKYSSDNYAYSSSYSEHAGLLSDENGMPVFWMKGIGEWLTINLMSSDNKLLSCTFGIN